MNKFVVVALAFALLFTGCATMDEADTPPQVSGDWYVSEADRKIDLPETAFTKGNFAASVLRKYDDDHELKLLRIAESIYPSRESVAQWRQLVRKDDATAPEGSGPEWSYLTFDGIRIPCAVTSAAVGYYLNLVKAFESGDFSQTDGLTIDVCRMRYSGVVDHHKWFDVQGRHFPECYVARLEILWAYECEDGSSMAFAKRRMVVMNYEGTVLGVYMDGPTDVERKRLEVEGTPETPVQ